MDYYSKQITTLIEELSKLPGVGSKSAQRLAFHIINMPQEQVASLAGAITQAKANIRYCKECYTLTDQELCPICSSDRRDHKTIMVVENTRDLAAYEKDLVASMEKVSAEYPGVTLNKISDSVWLVEIPAKYRVGHEAHFGQVTEHFLEYLKDGKLPDWEVPNMLSKYYTTTSALDMAKAKTK